MDERLVRPVDFADQLYALVTQNGDLGEVRHGLANSVPYFIVQLGREANFLLDFDQASVEGLDLFDLVDLRPMEHLVLLFDVLFYLLL